MRYGPIPDIKYSTNYKAHQQDIMTASHIKDLGVYMSDDAPYIHHPDNMVDTARTLSGWI